MDDDDLQIISDGDGVAIFGDPTAVARFVDAERLPSKEIRLPPLGGALAVGSTVAEGAAAISENYGQWVKLTKDSAKALDKLPAMTGSRDGLSRAIAMKDGKTHHIVEFFDKTPLSAAANPAILTGAATVMAQFAMQQTMDEITDYLAAIDEKVDDILRAQKDAVVARMIGAGLTIDEAMTLREHGGRVNDITWSKVESVPGTIAETQAYALRQLDALAEKLEAEKSVGDLANAAKKADDTVREWLVVLARCFQLQDAIAVLELDRVLEASPDDLDAHRRGLRAARERRRDLIAGSTAQLLTRLDAAAAKANTKVLLNPISAGTVVRSSNHVAGSVVDFRALLGIDEERQTLQARRWAEAAGEVRDKALETGGAVWGKTRDTGGAGWDAVERHGGQALGAAKAVAGKVSGGVAGRMRRLRNRDQGGADETEQRFPGEEVAGEDAAVEESAAVDEIRHGDA